MLQELLFLLFCWHPFHTVLKEDFSEGEERWSIGQGKGSRGRDEAGGNRGEPESGGEGERGSVMRNEGE